MQKSIKTKILYVDDEIINNLNFEVLFRDKYTVFTARNSEEAVEMIASKKPDIIFSDQKMPGKSGAEMFIDLVEKSIEGSDVPKIIVTGYSDNEEVNNLLDNKTICNVVFKPFKTQQIEKIISEQLA
ncbi:MAG: response regulator [Spirochaetales bacterium]|nr:response regulator [Spirochaetales bacterium]